MELSPGYKLTDVGIVPDDWEIRECNEISERIMVGIVIRPSQYYVPHGVPALRSANVREAGVTQNDLVYISEQSNTLLSKSQTKEGDVLTVRTGYPGTSAVVRSDLTGCNCIDILITRPSKVVDSDYLARWINSPFGKEQVLRNQGGLAQKHFNVGDMKNLLVALPRIAEQRAIAEALNDVDELLNGLDQLIAKKRDLKQAAIQQLLAGQTRLADFRTEWTEGTLGNVVKSLAAGVSVNSTEATPSREALCVLKTSALAGGTFLADESKVIESRDIPRARINPQRDTILISRMNTPMLVGEVAYVDQDYDRLFLPDRIWMASFRSESAVSVRWLSYVLSSRRYRDLLRDTATGTSGSMKNISKDALLSLRICYPSGDEQTAIATILSDMDAEITALEARRDKTRALKQAMMQELLTGRIRLPVDAAA